MTCTRLLQAPEVVGRAAGSLYQPFFQCYFKCKFIRNLVQVQPTVNPKAVAQIEKNGANKGRKGNFILHQLHFNQHLIFETLEREFKTLLIVMSFPFSPQVEICPDAK